MKSNYKLAIAMLAGAALGAAAAQGLHAQTKPLAYVISENDVTNKEAYAKEFVPLAVAALKDSGQKQLAAGGQTVSLSLASRQNRASFCRFLRTSTRRKRRIRLRLIWKLAKSATSTRNSEFLPSKAYHKSNTRSNVREGQFCWRPKSFMSRSHLVFLLTGGRL